MSTSSNNNKIVVQCPGCKADYVYTIPIKLPQKPRIWCNKCKSQFGVKHFINNIPTSTTSTTQVLVEQPPLKQGEGAKTPNPNYSNVNIKNLVQDTCIDIIKRKDSRVLGKALDILTKPEFIERGDLKDGIYWTSETPAYERPFWLFPWQPEAIDLMKNGNLLYRASRQAPGKTLAATFADFEDMLAEPGTVVTIVAPTVPLAKRLLHQMFHETIIVKRCEPRPEGGWEQVSTDLKINLWSEIFKPYFIYDGKLEKILKNGSRIRVITLDVAAVQGLSSDIIHIEEFDKIVKLTKQGDISDKLEAVAALLPQLRARPNSKIRITCNMASGLFDLLYDAVFDFGRYFLIYEEQENEFNEFTGIHTIANEDVMYVDKNGIPSVPNIDDLLKQLLRVLVSSSFAAQQLQNIKMHSEEFLNPKKVKIAYQKGKRIDNTRTVYPRTGMGADPGAGHAFAIGIAGSEGIGRDRKISHLWSENYYAADDWDRTKYDSKLEELADEVAENYCKYHCQFYATESNSGARLITPYIGAAVKKKLTTKPEYMHGKSGAIWKEVWSNFGAERPIGKDVPTVIPKNIFLNVLSMVFEYELIALQERTEAEQVLHRNLILYDPSKTAEKFKGDQADMLLHLVFHLVGGSEEKFLHEITETSQRLEIKTW
jgi:hypothetical protein